MMIWFQKIMESLGLGNLFQWLSKRSETKLAETPWKEEAIRSGAKKDRVDDEIAIDTKRDRNLKREPKDFIAFDNEADMVVAFEKQKKALYMGNKQDILHQVYNDYSDVIKGGVLNNQKKKLIKGIEQSNKQYFIVRVAPLTIHE